MVSSVGVSKTRREPNSPRLQRFLPCLLAGALLPLAARASEQTPAKTELRLAGAPSPEDLFRMRVFEEPLVPVGGEPGPEENTALAAALKAYVDRKSPDDFGRLEAFLREHPRSVWNAALLTDLGIEYHNTAYYSRALHAWAQAWALARGATDLRGQAIANRAAGELAYTYARLGRMTELEGLLDSVAGRVFTGQATEKIAGARQALANMKEHPEVSFRCGPLALRQIRLATDPQHPIDELVYKSASTQKGFSLLQVAELSRQAGLNYQMAYRKAGAEFIVPAVVHWKVGHYAALVRKEGNKYLLQDPTFHNETWATQAALEAETSGYFLIPSGPLAPGWRAVENPEGETVWGKGVTTNNDPGPQGPGDPRPRPKPCKGMAAPSVHLMLVNLHLDDEPVGYTPPVGPAVKFTVRYNHRDAFQPSIFSYSNFGSKWTCDWISYINDNPQNPAATVTFYMRGGGLRTFTGFNSINQSFAFEPFDHTLLTRTGPTSYRLTYGDGSQLIFSQSDGASGTSRKVFLTQLLDPFGNTVTLNYDGNLRLTGITDAIGQVTTLSYSNAADLYKITRVTDPFGRYATFGYDNLGRLTNITDVIGMHSQFGYETNGDFINTLITPYGTTTFTRADAGTTRWLETLYPDGSRERVEYNQGQNLGTGDADPPNTVPQGMQLVNAFLYARNTYYWSRNACALGYGDYTKARIYHWLHTADGVSTSGNLESEKEPLENRVWYNYAGQSAGNFSGANNLPIKKGRVLDDGTTQLYQYAYDGFGHVTNSVDPLGRTFSYIYSTNGLDLLEVRMTRGGKNELLWRLTYNAQHRPLTVVDSAGQTNQYTYNARGQLLAEINAKGETNSYSYDTNGYLLALDGPLAGSADTVSKTYDAFGRVRTKTDLNGYTLSFDYDALDRLTRITYPDGTFKLFGYDKLNVALVQDRAGRQTTMEYDALGQISKRTDPLNRVTRFQWCSCGQLKSLTDPMGRTTSWDKDVQGRLQHKVYADGSQRVYEYEQTSSRLRRVVDEKQQVQSFIYNTDDTLRSVSYSQCLTPTPGVTYTYDPDYDRMTSLTDGSGTTQYHYYPVQQPPVLGAGKLATITGPLAGNTVAFAYDELGRRIATTVNGVASLRVFDAAGRVMTQTNSLGSFGYGYDGSSSRPLSETLPNGESVTWSYYDNLHDRALQSILNARGSTPLSQFSYVPNLPAGTISSWSQQADAQTPDIYTLGYDAGNELLSASVTNNGALVNSFRYSYDAGANRLTEQVGSTAVSAVYNPLNQLSTCSGCPGQTRTNEWDGADRLTAVNDGATRTEYTYDGLGRVVGIRQYTNGVQASVRQLVWVENTLVEERDGAGALTKRFYKQGLEVVTGPAAGKYFYTRDHLGSVRELTDAAGTVRARYTYDPFGRRQKVAGDLEADFGFAGMLYSPETGLSFARFRVYDPGLGRWLSRDPLRRAELAEGPNLYAYVRNNPISQVDPLGLACECCQDAREKLAAARNECRYAQDNAASYCKRMQRESPETAAQECAQAISFAAWTCVQAQEDIAKASEWYADCLATMKCPKDACNPEVPKVAQVPLGTDDFAPGPDVDTSCTGREGERSAADTEASYHVIPGDE